jgi:hypothetical protein
MRLFDHGERLIRMNAAFDDVPLLMGPLFVDDGGGEVLILGYGWPADASKTIYPPTEPRLAVNRRGGLGTLTGRSRWSCRPGGKRALDLLAPGDAAPIGSC